MIKLKSIFNFKFYLVLSLLLFNGMSRAADLLEVYSQAIRFDPVFQQAISQRFATKEGVPIALASYLPSAFITANPSVARYGYTGTSLVETFVNPRNNTQLAYNLTLNLNQTIFDFAKLNNIASQVNLSKAANATLNDALQELILRVSTAYLTVLKDMANLKSTIESRQAYFKQLKIVKAQYERGIKTVTDVYTARASYQTSLSNELNAKRTLENDKENLRRLSGCYYHSLKTLSRRFKFIQPIPNDVEHWVARAASQNWAVKAARYQTESFRAIIKQQLAGHLPTVDVGAIFSRQYINNINSYNSLNLPRGPGTTSQRQVMLNINVPLLAGGGVISQTNQAIYNFEVSRGRSDEILVDTINQARTSFNNVSFLSQQVLNDRSAVLANQQSVIGMEVRYKMGVLELVDLLNQQLRYFQSQIQYNTNKYDYLINFLTLKKAAGTLSFEDVIALNCWLV